MDMDIIKINVGTHTSFDIDLSALPSNNVVKYVLTIKNEIGRNTPIIIEREFTTNGIHNVVITPEESYELTDSAVYDVDIIMASNKCYKATNNGRVALERGVGQCKEL